MKLFPTALIDGERHLLVPEREFIAFMREVRMALALASIASGTPERIVKKLMPFIRATVALSAASQAASSQVASRPPKRTRTASKRDRLSPTERKRRRAIRRERLRAYWLKRAVGILDKPPSENPVVPSVVGDAE